MWGTIAVVSVIVYLEKSLFVIMGEKLIKKIRVSLLEEIMHK